MSINPIKWIVSAFKFIKKLLGEITDDQAKVAEAVVKVLSNINNIVLSPGMDVLTAIIPGDIDNKIVQQLRIWLPKIMGQVINVSALVDFDDENEMLVALINQLKATGSEENVNYKHLKILAIGSGLTQAITGLDQTKATLANEGYYKVEFKNAA